MTTRRKGAGRSRTDWARLRAMTEDAIQAGADADPDNPGWTPAELARAEYVPPPKQPVTIRIDGEVLAWFKEQGPGYQTRMNAVLRSYVQNREAREVQEGEGRRGRAKPAAVRRKKSPSRKK